MHSPLLLVSAFVCICRNCIYKKCVPTVPNHPTAIPVPPPGALYFTSFFLKWKKTNQKPKSTQDMPSGKDKLVH